METKQRISRRLLTPIYRPFRSWFNIIFDKVENNAILLGQTMSHIVTNGPPIDDLTKAEFKVFSQSGEDGIIQYLISKVPIENEVFVEFGVGDYREANTRFLLMSNKWRGLVIDSSEKYVESITHSSMFETWRLKATRSFITRENINETIRAAGIEGDVGIPSIDIDGNDYWVWRVIDVIQPRIVICEVNHHISPEHAITIPYKPDFNYGQSHPSRVYFGASLAALCHLAEEKGYSLVGCTSEGVNAFFVRKDVVGDLKTLNAKSGFEQIKNEISPPVSIHDRLKVIEDFEVYDVIANKTRRIRELIG